MRIALGTALALALAACTAGGAESSSGARQQESADPAAAQDQVTRRIPQLENEHVEVWKSIIAPNQPLTMHRHDHPRAIIALRGGTLTVVTEEGDEHDVVWETGNAYWLEADPPGQMHGDVNRGDEPVEVIVVQLKGVGTITGPGGS